MSSVSSSRVRGRIIKLGIDTPNEYWPKLVILSFESKEFVIAYDSLAGYTTEYVCEPIEPGFSTDGGRVVYAPWNSGTLMFNLPGIPTQITWGSPLVRFTDKYTFTGTIA